MLFHGSSEYPANPEQVRVLSHELIEILRSDALLAERPRDYSMLPHSWVQT